MKEEKIKDTKNKKGPGMGGPGGGNIGPPPEKAKDFKGTIKRLLAYLRPFRLKFLFVFIFAIASTVFAILGPKVLSKAVNKIFEGVLEKVTGVAGGGIDFEYVK